jgi:hypothetical protein
MLAFRSAVASVELPSVFSSSSSPANGAAVASALLVLLERVIHLIKLPGPAHTGVSVRVWVYECGSVWDRLWVSVCLCVAPFVCVHVCVCMHLCDHVWDRVCVGHMCVGACVSMHVCVNHIYVLHVSVAMHGGMFLPVYVYARVFPCTCPCMTCVCVCLFMFVRASLFISM